MEINPVKELAEKRIYHYPHPALKNVSCEYQNGVLVLQGWVPTYYLKYVAQAAVAGMEAVRRIENRIQVKNLPWN